MQTRIGERVAYGMTTSGVMVQVHHLRPRDDEWDLMLEAMRVANPRLLGIIVVAPSGDGPSPTQRKQIGVLASNYPPTFRGVAMLSDSLLARGSLTAISWLIRVKFERRAFAMGDLEPAMTFLGLSPVQKAEVRILLGKLRPAQAV